ERVQWNMLTPRKTLAECFAQRHEQRRRNAFARDIAHKKKKTIFVEHESIVQIPSYLECRLQYRVEFQVSRQPLDGSGKGQHAHLNFPRGLEFAGHTGTLDSFHCQSCV